MAIRPTFYGFEMARSALSASQKSIDITGQNIANINTPGFSRQRVNLSSLGVGNLEWKYALSPADNVGLGVNTDNIQRIRDEFLDVRFWKDNSDLYRFNTKWNGLDAIEMLLDEFTMPNIQEGLFRFYEALQELNNNSDDIEYAKQALSIADTMTRTLNKTAVDMQTIVNEQIERLALVVKNINHAAASIDRLNKEIRTQRLMSGRHYIDEFGDGKFVGGYSSNELLDDRDMLIDELSSYANIRIFREEGGGISVYFGIGDDDEVLLVDGTRGLKLDDKNVYQGYEGYFNLLEEIDPTQYFEDVFERIMAGTEDVEASPFRLVWATGDNAGNDVIPGSGQIFGYYEMLNGIGDVDKQGDTAERDMASKGIPYFMNMVNAFAYTFAERLNDVNNGGSTSGRNDGGDLFDSSDGGAINARNIKIAEDWRENPYIILRAESDDENYIAENDNILRMLYELKREDLEITDPNGNILFVGSFTQYAVSLNSEITIEVNYNDKQLSISEGLVLALDNLRDAVKSVNEDEEAMNLMKFSKSYNAAARYMTVLDEMVDTIVHRLGIVGR